MKQLNEQVTLKKELEEITMSDFRRQPGEVITQVSLGKTFIISKSGNAFAVLSPVPGVELMIVVKPDGEKEYKLAS